MQQLGFGGFSDAPGRREFLRDLRRLIEGSGQRFKVPTFCGRELDLFRVYREVQQRGGFAAVCENKRWREVCRALNVDLEGQTSASNIIKRNYEKLLLEFELDQARRPPLLLCWG